MALVFQRRGKELAAARGQQCLVGGDDVLAILQRLLDEVEGVGGAADQLDDDIEPRVGD